MVRLLLLLTAAILLRAGMLHAQSTAPPDSANARPTAHAGRPRVGVVLSGGSAKALAHIGVLRVLEEVGVPVDVVTGTSMGAMIGGVYAIGYPAAVLEQVVTSLDWASYFQDAPQRRFLGVDRRLLGTRTLVSFPIAQGRLGLPSGVVGGQRVSELLARLTWPAQTERDFRRLPTPFAAVATDLATRDVVVLDHGSLAETLRASMSLPTVFKPVELDGRLLADGGLARNLPAQEARALGADVVICSDVSDSLATPAELRSMVDVLMQTIAFQMYASTVEQRRLCDVYIRPNRAGMSPLAFDQAREWVARGVAAARASAPQLREIARRAGPEGAPRRPRWTSLQADPARVREVVVQGAVGPTERVVRRALRLARGAWVTPDSLENAVERVYATGLFERVTYRLDAAGPAADGDSAAARDVDVVVSAAVASQDRLGFGFRFDGRYKASLLFAADLRNRAGFGSTTQLEVRLGEQLRLGAQFLRAGVVDSRLALGGTVAFTRTPIDIFAGGQRVDEVSVEVTNASALFGAVVSTNGLAGVQLKGEHSSAVSTITPLDTSASSSQTFYSVAAIFRRESFDRAMFPTRGTAVYAKSEWAGGEAKFSHHVLDARTVVPVAPTVSLIGRVTVGAALGGGQVPLQYRFFVGGVNTSAVFPETQVSFAGFRPQELSGAAVERVGGALQWEVRRNVFTTFRLDAGVAGDRLRFAVGEYRVRGAVSIGAATPFGPVELSGSGRSIGDLPRLELNIGVAF